MPEAADPATPATPTAPTAAVQESAQDSALFAKFIAQHEQALGAEGGGDDHAQTPNDPPRTDPRTPARAAARKPAAAAGNQPTRDPATGQFLPRGGAADPGEAEEAEADAGDGARAADGEAVDPRGADPDPASAGELSDVDALALLRTAREKGDKDGIDRALKALMPDSKGLGEFNVDGSRYAEFRQTVKKEKDKLGEWKADLQTREHNLQQGLSSMEQTVARLEPVEQLVVLAQREDADGRKAFLSLVQKLTRKNLSEVTKWELDQKLAKPADPRVDALERQLKEEREARTKREQEEREARELGERQQKIQRHLVFLDQELGKSQDPRVVALVKTPEGMRAIFEAQQAHFDQATGRTLSPEQAARYVLEQAQKNLEPWQKVFGAGAQPAPIPATTPAPGNQTPPAEPAPRAKPLGSSRANASNGVRKPLSDNELFAKYERLARL